MTNFDRVYHLCRVEFLPCSGHATTKGVVACETYSPVFIYRKVGDENASEARVLVQFETNAPQQLVQQFMDKGVLAEVSKSHGTCDSCFAVYRQSFKEAGIPVITEIESKTNISLDQVVRTDIAYLLDRQRISCGRRNS